MIYLIRLIKYELSFRFNAIRLSSRSIYSSFPIKIAILFVPGEGAFALIMGIISGYPVGAKIVTNFRKNGICTKEEGER